MAYLDHIRRSNNQLDIVIHQGDDIINEDDDKPEERGSADDFGTEAGTDTYKEREREERKRKCDDDKGTNDHKASKAFEPELASRLCIQLCIYCFQYYKRQYLPFSTRSIAVTG